MKAIEILAREYDERDANYDILLALLANIVDGKIDPRFIRVDLTARTWHADVEMIDRFNSESLGKAIGEAIAEDRSTRQEIVEVSMAELTAEKEQVA